MLVGLGAGILVSIAFGIALIHPVLSMPNRSHYKSLFNFSKFSFGNAIGGYIYEWAGIAIIGYFLSRQLVGVYGVVWGLSLIFMLLSQSIANVIYPKISNLSANGKKEEVKTIFFDGFIYSPMFVIPAFAGVLFISENLLDVMYGEEFKTGSLVLIILMLARIFQSFQIISVRTLEGIDRPDFVFKVNAVTTVLNLASTFIFVYLFGIVGAAISATLTILVSFLWNTNIVCRTLNVKIPWKDIVPQMLSAAIMGAAVSGISKLLPPASIQNLIIVILAGGAVYFAVLLSLSKRIKSKCLLIIKEVTHASSGAVEI
jgi:O-antigen/teichoic acid export membrane protein